MLAFAALLAMLLTPAGVSPSAAVGPPTAAPDGTTTTLPIDYFSDIVADPVHGHVFVTGGIGVGTDAVGVVIVADDEGRVVRTLRNVPGADGMVLSSDGSTLYVALERADAILAVNTTSFARHLYPTGPDSCPENVALAAGAIWFAVGCAPHLLPTLAELDPTTGSVDRSILRTVDAEHLLSAPPSDPDALMVAGHQVVRLTVSGGEHPTAAVAATASEPHAMISDIAYSANGKEVLVAGGESQHEDALDVDDLRHVDSYYSTRNPGSVASGPDGTVAVANMRSDKPYVLVYAPGQTVFSTSHSFNTLDDSLAIVNVVAGGLAVDSHRVFVITSDGAGSEAHLSLRTLSTAAPTVPALGGDDLRVPNVEQILADPVHHRAFVSTGAEGNGVFVLDSRGRIVRVIQHLPGPTQMTLDRATSTLYVALESGDAIAAINTSTLQVRRLSTGINSCPRSVAQAAGLLWFSYGDCYVSGMLGSMDPSTGIVRYHPRSAMGDQRFYSSPVHPDDLIGADEHAWDDYGSVHRWTVTGGTLSSAELANTTEVGPADTGAALSPDGLHLVTTPPSAHYVDWVLRSDDLSLAALEPASNSPVAVAVRSDGLVAEGIGSYYPFDEGGPNEEPAIVLRKTALGSVVGGVTLPGIDQDGLMPRGLAFGPRELYAVAENPVNVEGFHIDVVDMPPVHRLSLSTDQLTYQPGDTAVVVAHLTPGAAAQGRTVSIYAQSHGSSHRILVARGRVGDSGNLKARVPITRDTTYSAAAGSWRRSLSRSVVK